MTHSIAPAVQHAILALWQYTVINDTESFRQDTADIGLALGCHDPAVADHAARLALAGQVQRLVFSGATSPATSSCREPGQLFIDRP